MTNKKKTDAGQIVLSERGFEIMALLAFRYSINRHCTQSMTRGVGDGDTVESIVLANLDKINSNFKCQMMRDIKNELDCFDSLDAVDMCGHDKIVEHKRDDGTTYEFTYYSPYYLLPMFEALKKDYAATHYGLEWQEGMQS